MNKKWLSAIALGLILVLALPLVNGCSSPASAQEGAANIQISQQPQGIWVSGTGEVSVSPDIAILRLGVVSQQATVAEALEKASAAMTDVLQTLTDNGIEKKDIQTGSFNISQRTRWDDYNQMDKITGYYVSNMVTVNIRETDRVGEIIDAAVQAGGDLIRVDGINFSVENPAQYYEEAREKAIAAAKAKADELARLTGVKLGSPTYIVENAQYASTYGRDYANFSYAVPAPMIAESATSPISPGETKLTLSVQVAYSIFQ